MRCGFCNDTGVVVADILVEDLKAGSFCLCEEGVYQEGCRDNFLEWQDNESDRITEEYSEKVVMERQYKRYYKEVR